MNQKVAIKSDRLKSNVGRNAKWSLIQTAISAFAVFLLYKFLYGALGAEQLGLWTVVVASVSIGKLAELGFTTTVLRYVSQYSAVDEMQKAADIIETALVSIAIPLALLLLLAYPLVESSVFLVLPSVVREDTERILPFALATLWVGVAGSIIQSAIDGCGRMDLKCKILIAANFIYIPLAVFLTKWNGVIGLAIAQFIQSFFVFFICWFKIKKEFPSLSFLPFRWIKGSFFEMYKYAAGLQVGNLLLMLTEPATKMLLSRYCGLAEVAHFEMANQVVSRVRGLVVSGMQAYLPTLSINGKGSREEKRLAVREAFSFASGFGAPLMALLFVSFPFIGHLWIGHHERSFIVYGWILSIGWLLATLSMPTYFYCVGSGHIKTIVFSQVVRVGVNVGLGFFAAYYGYGYWVAFAMVFSLVIENFITAQRALGDMGFQSSDFRSKEAVRASVSLFFIIIVALQSALVFWNDLGRVVDFFDFFFSSLLLLLIAYSSDARVLLISRIQVKRG